ncbi:hypothetical protein Pfo_006846 [Paulownia fortunei]|nr:hypothetical protein Pfo_006846 [Paulownia fortunei]
MVQRKVPNKLGIQADHVKTSKLLVNLKPSSLQHQDAKNGGTDLKMKKMKKSGSIKRPELDSPRSQNLRKQVKQPGKPPPALALPTSGATLQKQSPAAIPNYMKSTTSTDARKEQSQVSTKSPQTSPDNSCSHSSKISLALGNKATKTLARTSSLKMMRTLIKTPSFKPARALVKKCSPVVLCKNLDVERATCSSTSKDCKFPAYLKLSPGGTESEGTSAMKVCPYNYCSLNGHRHAPLPPLKCFLSARRRMLKTQRSIKLGCLSPRRARPNGGGSNFDEKLPFQDDMNGSTISSLTQEEHSDFFIEIYNTGNEDTADLTASVEGRDETAAENHEEKVVEMLSDGPLYYDIDSCENIEQTGDLNSKEIATAAHFHEENIAEEVSPPSLAQEAKLELLSDVAVESMPSVDFHEIDSDSSGMDWETGQHSLLYLDDDYEYTSKTENEPDQEGGKVIIHAGFIIKLDNRLSCRFDEVSADEVSQESFDEESLSSDTLSTCDGESVGSYDYLESFRNLKTLVPVVVPVGEPEAAPEDKNDFLFEGNQTPITGPHIGDTAMCYNIMVEEETSLDNLKDEYLPNEEAIAVMGKQAWDLLKGPVEEMGTCGGKAMYDTITKDQVSNQTSTDEGHQVQNEDHFSDEYQSINSENQDQVEKECHQAENFKPVSPMDSENEPHSEVSWLNSTEPECHIIHEVKARNLAMPETEDSCSTQAKVKCKKLIPKSDEPGHFNPRAPNFLPLEPGPEAEKVDLRHQELDERKNTEEWMVDYALRQAVKKLGPARKRKVALLVEAFEKVMPTTK